MGVLRRVLARPGLAAIVVMLAVAAASAASLTYGLLAARASCITAHGRWSGGRCSDAASDTAPEADAPPGSCRDRGVIHKDGAGWYAPDGGYSVCDYGEIWSPAPNPCLMEPLAPEWAAKCNPHRLRGERSFAWHM
jgi:hypothetical protein